MTTSELLSQLLQEARRSNCDKIRFGAAVLNRSDEILALGHNHNPASIGGWSCATQCVGDIRKGVKSGTCVERCFSIHAEQHALIQVSPDLAYEVAVAGLLPDGSLFDNGGGFYCTVCVRIMRAAGVRFVTIWSKGESRRLTIAEAWDQSYSIATA